VSRATGFDIDEHSDTLREVVWSTAAQHGRAPIVISLGALPFLLAGISPPLRDPEILDPVIAETAAYKACLKKAKYDFNAANLCNLDEYNRWYRVLDTYISKAIKVAPVKTRARVKIRNEYWASAMWKTCGLTQTIDFERGTMDRMESSFCILESVENRVKWVKMHWLDRAKAR
jgi:hypothetical protein